MAAAAPKPEDRLAFADELAQVRADLEKRLAENKQVLEDENASPSDIEAARKHVEQDVYGEFQEELKELEFEYQFILLRSLTLFHKEMRSGSLPERLHEIKENLTGTVGKFDYQTNLPDTNWDWNSIICKQCRKMGLRPMPGTNELFCPRCGVLETLDGAYFDYEEVHKCGDFKIVKQRRTRRKYSFRNFLEKHRKIITSNGHILSFETIKNANEIFERIEEYLPKRISMPFVAYKILTNFVKSTEEKYVLNYFFLQVPQNAVAKHIGKWNEMLWHFDAQEA